MKSGIKSVKADLEDKLKGKVLKHVAAIVFVRKKRTAFVHCCSWGCLYVFLLMEGFFFCVC